MTGERVKLAREACGLTQQGLADLAGISQSLLSDVEAGRVLSPSAENLAAIAQATGFPASFFARGPLPDMPEGSYRRLARGTAKVAKQVRAQTRHIVEIVQRSERLLKLPPIAVTAAPQPVCLDEIESLVVKVRESLGVGGLDPIPVVMRAVERSGVVVVRLPGEMEAHDSYSVWPDFGLGGRPVIALTGGHPGDRDRFNVGHELGHLVLHTLRSNVDHKQAEAEAHRFAGALLLPAEAAAEAMPAPITLRVLMGVKATYGISIAAAARRALDLALIGHPQYESIQKQLSARQWKRNEPVEVPREQPVLISKILDALGGSGSTLQKAERVGMPVFAFHALYAPP